MYPFPLCTGQRIVVIPLPSLLYLPGPRSLFPVCLYPFLLTRRVYLYYNTLLHTNPPRRSDVVIFLSSLATSCSCHARKSFRFLNYSSVEQAKSIRNFQSYFQDERVAVAGFRSRLEIGICLETDFVSVQLAFTGILLPGYSRQEEHKRNGNTSENLLTIPTIFARAPAPDFNFNFNHHEWIPDNDAYLGLLFCLWTLVHSPRNSCFVSRRCTTPWSLQDVSFWMSLEELEISARLLWILGWKFLIYKTGSNKRKIYSLS